MKVLVSDFDNTFFTSDYENNIKRVNKFIEEGNIFIIATGRPIYLLKKDLDSSIKYSYLICNDGAVIFDKDDNKIFNLDIDKKTAEKVYSFLKNDTNNKEVYIDTSLEFSTSINSSVNGVLALPEDRDKALSSINEILKNNKNIHAYLSHRWINVLNKKASKGEAIKYLSKINKWNVKDIITIGDDLNDISMMKDFNSYFIVNDKTNLDSKNKCLSFIDMLDREDIMNLYDIEITTRDDKKIKMDKYKGKVLIVVNTATGCGFTPQYEALENLYKKYHDKGLEILDFPCNQFGNQAPGSDDEIHEFCALKYDTTFDQLKKVDVNGENEEPIFKYLKENSPKEYIKGMKNKLVMGGIKKISTTYKKDNDILWNFTKFLVDKEGKVVFRLSPIESPNMLEEKIIDLLK